MRLSLIFRAKGHFYVAFALGKNGGMAGGAPAPEEMPIKKVGKIFIIFTGIPVVCEAIAQRIDFSFLGRHPLNELNLVDGFLKPLAECIERDHLLEKEADGTVPNFGCQALFVSDDKAFVFDERGFTPVPVMAAIGEEREMALSCLVGIHTGFDPQSDVNQALGAVGKLIGRRVYPLLIPHFETGNVLVHQENGNEVAVEIPDFPKIEDKAFHTSTMAKA